MNNRSWTFVIVGIGCLLLLIIAAIIPLVLGAFFIVRTDRFPSPGPIVTEEIALEGTGALNALYEQVSPGVVSIQAQVTIGEETGFASGSGFILDEQGHIVTNHHVVLGSDLVTVTFFNGIQAQAEVIGRDPDSDLALLRVEGLIPEVHPLPLADSSQVRVGDEVVAIGNPFAFANSMTYGIVSAVGRVIPSGFTLFNIPQTIQTDAAINPGNSGGPLINMNGEVIGVNAQIRTEAGLQASVGVGFAIPSNTVTMIAPALIGQGDYQWPWLGVTGLTVTQSIMQANNLETQRGAYIHIVIPDGPAEAAGLQGSTGQESIDGVEVPTGGDVVVEANGEPVLSFDDLLNAVVFSQPGDEMVLTVLRNGERLEIPVTLQPRPEDVDAIPIPVPTEQP